MNQTTPDVAVIGASLGGVLAAWQACKQDLQVVLVSSYPWIGGQLTAQAVPPDEHSWIEQFGASESYQTYRKAIRQHYLDQADFQDNTQMTEGCNPGDGWVSRLCHEPKDSHEYLVNLLKPFLQKGQLTIKQDFHPISAKKVDRKIHSVDIKSSTGELETIAATFFIDGTDTGDLLQLAEIPYRLGKESQSEFGEPDAPEVADILDQQPVTYVMALRQSVSQSAPIEKPENYDFWLQQKVPGFGYPLFSDNLPGGEAKKVAQLPWFAEGTALDYWRYRRVICKHNWSSEKEEVSLVNWPQNDYALHPLLEGAISTDEVVAASKNLSQCFVYWLQTAANRPDGGQGFPNLQLAPDVMGTEDGFAQQVYVRESRRLAGVECLKQQQIAREDELKAATVRNSVGIGCYNLDIHPTCVSGQTLNAKANPFEIPFGCFVSDAVDNFLPACKNISVTHLVNAATRVHPIEWLIGEVGGLTAAYCIQNQLTPVAVHNDQNAFSGLQQQLLKAGIPLHWPEDAFN